MTNTFIRMPAISKRRRQLQEARYGQQRIKEKKQDEQLEGAVHEQIDETLSGVPGSIASFSSSNSSGTIASDICAQIANIISTLSDRSYLQL